MYISLEVLQTTVIEAELILNDWPLTYFSDDIWDQEPLAPSYLLHGRRLTTLTLLPSERMSRTMKITNLESMHVQIVV